MDDLFSTVNCIDVDTILEVVFQVHVTTDVKKPRIPEFHGMYIKKSVPLALDGVQIPVVAQKDSEAGGTKTENIAGSGVNGVHETGPLHTNTTHSSQVCTCLSALRCFLFQLANHSIRANVS